MRGMIANLQTMQQRRLTHSLSLTLGSLCICIWICKSNICIWICIWICICICICIFKSSSMKGLRVVQGFCEPGQTNSNKFQNLIKNSKQPRTWSKRPPGIVSHSSFVRIAFTAISCKIFWGLLADIVNNFCGHICWQKCVVLNIGTTCIYKSITPGQGPFPHSQTEGGETQEAHLSFRVSPQICSFNVIPTCKWFRVRTYSLGRTYLELLLIAQAGEPFGDGGGADHM